jgi:hypothetical protein
VRRGRTTTVGLCSVPARWEWPNPPRSNDSPRMLAATGEVGDAAASCPTSPTCRHRESQDAANIEVPLRVCHRRIRGVEWTINAPSEVLEPMLGLGSGFVGYSNLQGSTDQARGLDAVQAAMRRTGLSRRAGVVSGAPQNSGTSPFNQWLAGIRKPPGPRAHALSPLR